MSGAEGESRAGAITVRRCQVSNHIAHQQNTITRVTRQGTFPVLHHNSPGRFRQSHSQISPTPLFRKAFKSATSVLSRTIINHLLVAIERLAKQAVSVKTWTRASECATFKTHCLASLTSVSGSFLTAPAT